MKIKIRLSNGQNLEKSFDKTTIVIGRSSKSDFSVPDEVLSRHHCQIEVENGGFFITDLGSANGVFLDGKRIDPHTRTPFTTFLQLNLGPLECQVIYTDNPTFSSVKLQTSTTLELEKLMPNTSKSIKKPVDAGRTFVPAKEDTLAPKKSKLSPSFLLALLIAAGVAYYYYEEEKPQVFTPPPVTTPGPVTAPDRFFSRHLYEEKDLKKSCTQELNLCKELDLLELDAEGVLVENNEYFIFMTPFKNAGESAYSKIKDLEDRDALIALTILLRSSFFDALLRRQIAQIHFIIKDRNSKPSFVLRFHPKYFSADGKERQALKTHLEGALANGDDTAFWGSFKSTIKFFDLEK